MRKECLKMLKEEWLAKYCNGDAIALLRFLDVETYETVGESVMEALLKDGVVKVQGQSIRQCLTTANTSEGIKSSGLFAYSFSSFLILSLFVCSCIQFCAICCVLFQFSHMAVIGKM